MDPAQDMAVNRMAVLPEVMVHPLAFPVSVVNLAMVSLPLAVVMEVDHQWAADMEMEVIKCVKIGRIV